MSDWESTEGEHWATNADRYTRMLAGFCDIVTTAASCRPGERVLDVGCGNGDVALAAARAVGESGAVHGVDLSPAMLAVAAGRAIDEGLANVSFETADAGSFTPDVDGFDVVVSRFGVMFFDDPAAAFAHIRSLMAPAGRVAFVCWRDLFANDWMIVPGAAVAEVLPLPVGDDPTAPGAFAFADADRITDILTTAGFTDPSTAPVTASLWMGDNATDAANFMRTTGLGRAVFDGAPPELEEEAVARATASLVPYESPSGVLIGGAAWLVTASA
jgi:SAM-dependent methyltransferase